MNCMCTEIFLYDIEEETMIFQGKENEKKRRMKRYEKERKAKKMKKQE